MVACAIDAAELSGAYRVECSCGEIWIGQAERVGFSHYSPALPIAESVAHAKLAHAGDELNIRFTQRFEEWLQHYWELASLRNASQLNHQSPQRGTVIG